MIFCLLKCLIKIPFNNLFFTMSLTCFIYSWDLLIKNDTPLINGFGYDEKIIKHPLLMHF